MFKKLHIIIFIFISAAALVSMLTACTGRINLAEKEIEELRLEIAGLQQDMEMQEEELAEHDILTRNLNLLLDTVYYGSAVPTGEGREKNFTAFAMYYRDDFYLITAGHCVEYDGIKYTDFRFKSNGKGYWIYPDLLYYKADYENNRDFAIFSNQFIRKGLMVEEDTSEPRYVLGNFERKLNFFREFGTALEGESGSPILSSGCKLVGIVIKNNQDYTPITEVTKAIDGLLDG